MNFLAYVSVSGREAVPRGLPLVLLVDSWVSTSNAPFSGLRAFAGVSLTLQHLADILGITE